MQTRWLLLGLLALLTAGVVNAQSFTYQGLLKDSGSPANGAYDFRFMLWTQPTGGSQIGPELYVDAVSVQNGLFTVQLDFGSVWDGSDRYLEIRVRRVGQFGYWLLQPRVKINPTPYAAFALRPWQTAGSVAFYNDGNVGIGTNAPAARLSLGGGDANTKLALWQGGTAGEVMGFGIAPNQFRLHLHRPSNRFSFLDAPNGSELLTILGNGNVGVGVSNPAHRLQVETGVGASAVRVVHTATSGQVDGLKGIINTSTRGAAVSGEATAASGTTYGVYGQSNSTSGVGVYGWAIADSGTTYGVYGQSNSPAGFGVAGWATAASGQTGGVLGVCQSSGGAGVAGFNIATAGTNFGVYGESRSPAGRGVYGVAIPDNGTNFGVLGQTYSPDGYGVYSLGRLAATNKMFQIDHPLRPETHYLNHFCIEGPEPYTAYSGNVVTDEKGYATVQLPEYFESINRDFRYHLTVIDASDDFVQAKVVREIQSNQFIIRTSKPSVKVSWEVKAVRNDLWIQRYGYQAEQEKPEGHRGKYLHPELYGQPKERGIFHHPEPARPHGGEQP